MSEKGKNHMGSDNGRGYHNLALVFSDIKTTGPSVFVDYGIEQSRFDRLLSRRRFSHVHPGFIIRHFSLVLGALSYPLDPIP